MTLNIGPVYLMTSYLCQIKYDTGKTCNKNLNVNSTANDGKIEKKCPCLMRCSSLLVVVDLLTTMSYFLYNRRTS